MNTHPEPQRPDLIHQIPRDAYYQLIHTLRATLPPVSDAPEDIARRDHAAIAHVACLLPANADEADLAAKYVAAGAHAMECLRLARKYFGDAGLILKCTAQAASMLRQARSTRSLLMRVQAERRTREADGASLDGSNWTGHSAAGLMTEALADTPRIAIAPPPPEPRAPKPAETEAKLVCSTGDIAAEADRYALGHRKRAALIRALGRLPDKRDFGPLSPELVRVIVTGSSPVLRSLDKHTRQPDRIAA